MLDAARLKQFFKSRIARDIVDLRPDVFPGYSAPFIRRPPERDSGDGAVPEREALVGRFGVLPHGAKDEKLTKSTYNARSETVATKPAFRDAWKRAHHSGRGVLGTGLETGKNIRTGIQRTDGKPLGIAGLWNWWRPPGRSNEVHSFTMLTINADTHPVIWVKGAQCASRPTRCAGEL